jgi:DNA mismatch repair ATPase MutS
MQWCRPDVSERAMVDEDINNASVQSNQEAGMMVIRKGRHPIDFSDNLITGDESQDFIPNDTFASDEKPFTVITGINGTLFPTWTMCMPT